MAALKLSQFLGEVVLALNTAQRLADAHTSRLSAASAKQGRMTAVPHVRFQTVKLSLKLAFAAEGAADTTTVPPKARSKVPRSMVYVDAADLSSLPDTAISTLELTLRVDEDETVDLLNSPT